MTDQPRGSFGYVYCLLLDGLFVIYFGWLSFLMSVPVVKVISKHGIPLTHPKVMKQLLIAASMELSVLIPFLIVFMTAVWLLRRDPAARGFQALFAALMMVLAFPLGTLLCAPALYFVWWDKKTQEVLGAGEMVRKLPLFSLLIAGILSATVFCTGNQGAYHFDEGFGQILKSVGQEVSLKNPLRGLGREHPSGSRASSENETKQSGTHTLILHNGNSITGSAVQFQDDGFLMKTDLYGDVFFAFHEIQSIDGKDPKAWPRD